MDALLYSSRAPTSSYFSYNNPITLDFHPNPLDFHPYLLGFSLFPLV